MEQGASLGEANALKDAFGFGWGKFGVEMGKGLGAGAASQKFLPWMSGTIKISPLLYY